MAFNPIMGDSGEIMNSENRLKTVIPVRLDKKTVASVRKLCKQLGLPFSTVLRVLILEGIKTRENISSQETK